MVIRKCRVLWWRRSICVIHVGFKFGFWWGGIVKAWWGLLSKINRRFILDIRLVFWVRVWCTSVAISTWFRRRTIWEFISSERGIIIARRAFARTRILSIWTTRGCRIIRGARRRIIWYWTRFFYRIVHSEIFYDHSVKRDYGNRFYQDIWNESLSVNESAIYIESHEKIDEKNYYCFYYEIEGFEDNICWRLFKCWEKEGVGDFDSGLDSLSLLSLR